LRGSVCTHVNEEFLSQIKLGETEEIHFKSHDGLEIEGFITKPPSFNPAVHYPTLLLIHGGPVSQYSYGFSFEAQLFAANDYVVVRSNPRGSSGYGRDFCFALYQGDGEKDYRDVLAAVDHAIELGYSDPDRLGVGGYSYGGILTNYIITQTDRFKGAVSGAGTGLSLANYGHDMYQRWWESEFGLPWETRELWDSSSAFNHIQNVSTATLFACGEKDWNVPVQNSEQLYQALRRRGITTRLVVYPGEHHGGWTMPHQKDFARLPMRQSKPPDNREKTGPWAAGTIRGTGGRSPKTAGEKTPGPETWAVRSRESGGCRSSRDRTHWPGDVVCSKVRKGNPCP